MKETLTATVKDERRIVTVCNEVIHYPSEDYPCLCEEMAGIETCTTCGHKTTSHETKRVSDAE